MTAGIVASGVEEFWVKLTQGVVLLAAVSINKVLARRAA